MVLTTGITDGPLVARQEIRVFAKDQDLMNLFLLGMRKIQEVDESKTTSWFQIAGIHGRPYVTYDGAAPSPFRGGQDGYCVHSLLQFPTWHRPYLALLEQEIYNCMIQEANRFTDPAKKTKYLEAAKRFRLPYWDWAANGDIPDFISQQPTVQLETPDKGIVDNIPNPLYQYNFQKKGTTFGLRGNSVFNEYKHTVRAPVRNRNGQAESSPSSIEREMASNRASLRARVYNLLVNAKNYWSFSHDEWRGDVRVNTMDSLESLHGNLHNFIGSENGHMSSTDFAAFDPIFWFHHCNVDRLFAIWQALYPKEWFQGADRDQLTPFWRKQGVYWTSNDARDTRTLNYTYPELAKWSDLSPQEKSARLHTDINLMYGSRAAPFAAIVPDLFKRTAEVEAHTTVDPKKLSIIKAHKNRSAETPAQELPAKMMRMQMHGIQKAQEIPLPAPVQMIPVAKEEASTTAEVEVQVPALETQTFSIEKQPEIALPPPPTVERVLKEYNEWTVNISVEKYAVRKPFLVYIFIGDFEPDSSTWATDPDLVGTWSMFGNELDNTQCANCHEAAEQHKMISGSIPLTNGLVRKGFELGGLDRETIVPYLTRELHWRVTGLAREDIKREDIPSLKVSVTRSVVSVPESLTEFPVWGEPIQEPEITVGRPGGAAEGDM
ncbi:Tyrosinase; AltName: Full=Monophenol monooxygenase [Serendipita indica DSM 11827]|uniref:tyrosinase n=1 Tax=Serendipita indica (strain DSM 11827) TaxID=1109443 RepID=G4TM95_SERID|nr:Tyrosinase; AltName: Full=Monophenol monooxygenase [Serendipita indica DSM 11827]CCA72438.1 related to tyrosinase precursor (monophenol monooxygenase) [Serendipita indica DSM 11827]